MVKSKTGRAEALAPPVRAAIARIDKDQLVSVASVTTLEDVEWAATGRHRFRAVMVVGVRDAGGGARDGRRVRHPRVFGPAAGARLRRAPRARRDDQDVLRLVVGERREGRRDRRDHRPGPVGRVRAADRDRCCSVFSRSTSSRSRS